VINEKIPTELLFDLKDKFATMEIKGEHLIQQLENKKSLNSKLVQWKALNLKKTDELLENIHLFNIVGDKNISKNHESAIA
jgi:hypothetical protein